MAKDAKSTTASALALVVALTACGKQTLTPQAAAIPRAAASQPGAGKATVLGALNDVDWYMVVAPQDTRKKPIVIWTGSKTACDRNVAEFSLKAVDTASAAEPPEAWCLIGKDVRTKLGV